MMTNVLVAGTTEYHEALRKLELKLGRKLSERELAAIRKACKQYRPAKGQGKTQTRGAMAFEGQGKTISKRARVAQLPVDWQSN